jgi:hypothetical protein
MDEFGLYAGGAGKPTEEQVRALATLSGLAPADARQALLSRIPRRVSEHADRSDAEALSARLRAAGVAAFVVEERERTSFAPPEVRGAALGEGELSFRPSGRFGPGELCVVVTAEVRSSVEARSEATLRDPTSVTRKIGAGSGLVRREETEAVVFLSGPSPVTAFELRARRFDFRCLGGALAATRGENLRRFLDWLHAANPGAVFDDTLERHPLTAREDEGFSSAGLDLVGNVETRTKTSSTDATARSAAFVIAASRLLR